MTLNPIRKPMPRFYHGWVIVLACNLVACITWGVAIFNQGVFVAYFMSAYGWSPAVLSVGPVLFHLWAGVAGIFVGRIVDRRGPQPVLIAGAFVICLALFGFGMVRQAWHTYPVFILLGTGFSCIHTITLGKIVARWFVRQRSRAMAAATFGAGIGGALLVPLNAAMIESYGIHGGILALAAVTLIVILPLALWVIKDGPETLGLLPDGDTAEQPRLAVESEEHAADVRVWTVPEAMRTMAFWGLSFCFGLGMLAQSAYLFHQVPFLQSTLGLLGAASVVTVTTITGMIGRTIFILTGDRVSAKTWTAILFALQTLSFLVLAFATEPVGLTVGSALFGLTMGVLVTLQPLATAQCFGRESFGRIYGPIYMSIRTGAALGPGIVGILLATNGDYAIAWLTLASCLTIALIAIPWALTPPGRSSGSQPQRAT